MPRALRNKNAGIATERRTAFGTARCAEKGNIETVELGKVAPNRTSSKKLIKEESPADRYGRGLRR